MKVTPILMTSLYKKNSINFKAKSETSESKIYYDTDTPEQEYEIATWGPNYTYRVPKRPKQVPLESQPILTDTKDKKRETPEEFLQRKINSIEFTM